MIVNISILIPPLDVISHLCTKISYVYGILEHQFSHRSLKEPGIEAFD